MLFAESLRYALIVSVIHMVSSRRIRHGLSSHSKDASNAFSDSNVLARLQSDILSNLGMRDIPASGQIPVPDYARQLALEQAAASNQPPEGEEHFMEGSTKLLLIAQKGIYTYMPVYLCVFVTKF